LLNEILNYLNNYFADTDYSFETACTFTASDTIAGDFADTYIMGEYIRIKDTRLNDGVYLVKTVSDIEITIDATVDLTVRTEAEVTAKITKADIPRDLISLIAEIKTYNTSGIVPIASESQGNRSVTYVKDSSWKSVYTGMLSNYRKLRW